MPSRKSEVSSGRRPRTCSAVKPSSRNASVKICRSVIPDTTNSSRRPAVPKTRIIAGAMYSLNAPCRGECKSVPSMSQRMTRRSVISLNDHEHVAGVDGRAGLGAQLGDGAGLGRLQLVLHLHRFDDDQALTRFDCLSRLDEHAHDLARHRRLDLCAPSLLARARVRPAQMLRVCEPHAVLARAHRHTQRAAPRGTRLRTDAALVHAPPVNQKVLARAYLTRLQLVEAPPDLRRHALALALNLQRNLLAVYLRVQFHLFKSSNGAALRARRVSSGSGEAGARVSVCRCGRARSSGARRRWSRCRGARSLHL